MQGEQLAQRLVEGCHVLAGEGQGDLIWGHASARHDGAESFAMKPAGLGLDEIEATDLLTVDLEGRKLSGAHPLHVEVFIHSEIMRRRPDVRAVVHTHPMHAVAFSALGRPLLALGHEGAMFCDGLPVFTETSDLIVTADLGRNVAAAMGEGNAVLLRNHGIVTAGRSVEEAVMTAILLEKACRMQLLAEAAGEVRHATDEAEAEIKRQRIYTPAALQSAFRYCARRHSGAACGCGGAAARGLRAGEA